MSQWDSNNATICVIGTSNTYFSGGVLTWPILRLAMSLMLHRQIHRQDCVHTRCHSMSQDTKFAHLAFAVVQCAFHSLNMWSAATVAGLGEFPCAL